jgi:hypothetical protein
MLLRAISNPQQNTYALTSAAHQVNKQGHPEANGFERSSSWIRMDCKRIEGHIPELPKRYKVRCHQEPCLRRRGNVDIYWSNAWAILPGLQLIL